MWLKACVRIPMAAILEKDLEVHLNSFLNHNNYNFLDCDCFKKLLFSTNSLAKLLSDSLLLDSSISQSDSKL